MLVVDSIIGDAQTCNISKKSVHDNLHYMQFIENVGEKPVTGGILINLNQLKCFNWVDNQILVVVFMVAAFDPVSHV